MAFSGIWQKKSMSREVTVYLTTYEHNSRENNTKPKEI